ncbi:MAG: iron-containing alcohol dehydrogenase [Candidatus Marinimicrobia bacterium]|nr:iron-containing alcohol dehydrogenase [Candidatus Neomarinimicrobiota bacterium]
MQKFNPVNLRKFLMPELVFGNGARHLAGNYCRNFNIRKVLIVTDKKLAHSGLLNDVVDSIKNQYIEARVFSNVSPNPRDFEVMEGTDLYLQENCEAIVALGGGSPMDCAKGIGIVSQNGGHILDYKGINRISTTLPPMIFIPTTAGTSSDVSQFTIILDSTELIKIAIISKVILPDISLIDPETTLSMGPYLTACTGMDAMTHAIEAFVSIANSPITDLHALKAIETIDKILPQVPEHMNNIQLREKIMFASFEAGLAFSNAMLGAVHAMSHSLGGYLDLPHGECNSLLLEHVINFNYTVAEERFKKIARTMEIPVTGLNSKEIKNKLFDHIQSLKLKLGITKSLKDIGVTGSDIPILSQKAKNDACLLTNPRNAELNDIRAIFEEAY